MPRHSKCWDEPSEPMDESSCNALQDAEDSVVRLVEDRKLVRQATSRQSQATTTLAEMVLSLSSALHHVCPDSHGSARVAQVAQGVESLKLRQTKATRKTEQLVQKLQSTINAQQNELEILRARQQQQQQQKHTYQRNVQVQVSRWPPAHGPQDEKTGRMPDVETSTQRTETTHTTSFDSPSADSHSTTEASPVRTETCPTTDPESESSPLLPTSPARSHNDSALPVSMPAPVPTVPTPTASPVSLTEDPNDANILPALLDMHTLLDQPPDSDDMSALTLHTTRRPSSSPHDPSPSKPRRNKVRPTKATEGTTPQDNHLTKTTSTSRRRTKIPVEITLLPQERLEV